MGQLKWDARAGKMRDQVAASPFAALKAWFEQEGVRAQNSERCELSSADESVS